MKNTKNILLLTNIFFQKFLYKKRIIKIRKKDKTMQVQESEA